MKHRLLRVVQRLFQYQVLLTGRPRGRSGCTRAVGKRRQGEKMWPGVL